MYPAHLGAEKQFCECRQRRGWWQLQLPKMIHKNITARSRDGQAPSVVQRNCSVLQYCRIALLSSPSFQSASSAAHARIFFASGLVWIEPRKTSVAELPKRTFGLQIPKLARRLYRCFGLTASNRHLLQSPQHNLARHGAPHRAPPRSKTCKPRGGFMATGNFLTRSTLVGTAT